MAMHLGKLIVGSVATVAAAALLGWGLYAAFDHGLLMFNHPSVEEFPVRGIDVSHHQGKIDWAQVASADVHFAFIKATEGGDFVDPEFAANWAAAGKTAIRRGAYHFFTFCRKPSDQLRHIIQTIPLERGTFPPVLDLEFGGNCAREPLVAEMATDLAYMINGISRHYGREPILYMTQEFLRRYHTPAFPTAVVWIRDVFGRPELPAGMQWHLWQYANRGRVEGITTVVDLNVLRGTEAELDALLL